MTEIKAVPQSDEADVLLAAEDRCHHPETDGGYCVECMAYLPHLIKFEKEKRWWLE